MTTVAPVYARREIATDAVAAARAHAFAVGRVLEREHFALLSWGAAARLELEGGLEDGPSVASAVAGLRAIAPYDRESTADPGGPLALGALAFDRAGWSELIVPALTVIATPGRAVAIAVGPPDEVATALAAWPFAAGEAAPTRAPDAFTLASVRPHEDFEQQVGLAVEAIRAGEIDKVVLVREVEITANRPLRQHHLLERLRALHPSCCTFAIDGFVGASPELLVRRRGGVIDAQPLAGTVARSGDPEEDRRLAEQLLASAKDRAEHRFVVDAILTALAPYCRDLDAPAVPHLLELRNVAHLATHITGELADEGEDRPDVLTLVAEVHPTPAVGGSPRAAALEYLAKFEPVERGRFAGPVGYLAADGDGEWWIGIRAALLEGERTRLLAGVGIVAGSEPTAELAETQLKLQALLAAAVRP